MRTLHHRLCLSSLSFLTMVALTACGSGPGSTTASSASTSSSGAGGHGGDATGGSGGGGTIHPTGSGGSGPIACAGSAACPDGTLCRYEMCIVDRGTCASNNDCPGDSYCDTSLADAPSVCVPYGVPSDKVNDDSCTKPEVVGEVIPTIQCEWAGAPDDDPTKRYNLVYTLPLVADLNLDENPSILRPSIVMTTWTTESATGSDRRGVLRVFDGRTCAEQMRIGGLDDPNFNENLPAYGAQFAIGDLDGDVGNSPDGHPEIVGFNRPGTTSKDTLGAKLGVIAYGIDTSDLSKPKLFKKWQGRVCDPSDASKDVTVTFGGASQTTMGGLWDLDNDGKPEFIADSMVFDANGCLLNAQSTWLPADSRGSILADVDNDGRPDLIRANGIYGWDTATNTWVKKDYYVQTGNPTTGYSAVADLGDYSRLDSHPGAKLPEIALVRGSGTTATGTVRIQSLSGETVFGPVDLYHHYDASNPLYSATKNQYGGNGGPPTISDFDGDGYAEVAVAANQFYTVYDPDCTADGLPLPERPGGKCERGAPPPGISALPAGVLWAQLSQDFSSSITGSSIFDFNGDGKAEAVYRDECFTRVYDGPTGEVLFSYPTRSQTGVEMPTIADVNGNFATQIVVPLGGNITCPSFDPLVPGATAETTPTPKTTGFIVLRDGLDRWASSRPIWNQHAYSVTNVNDDATIPKSSDLKRNWETPGLNNFRQNVQGSLGALKVADLTVELDDLSNVCGWGTGDLALSARVCNRGTNPVTDGAEIGFAQRAKGAPADGPTTPVCTTSTPQLLDIGECTTVSCTGYVDGALDVLVIADPDGAIADCHPNNNKGASALLLCPSIK